MSDNAIALICGTIMALGILALAGFAIWLDSDRASHHQQTKAQRGIHRGIQPDTRPDPLVPPNGGSGTHRPRGKPVDLNNVTPPQQPSAVAHASDWVNIPGKPGPKDGEA